MAVQTAPRRPPLPTGRAEASPTRQKSPLRPIPLGSPADHAKKHPELHKRVERKD
ncbi:hypothetical protein GCM10010358_83630 [Streptomyces minutiscleroticus]|uniref:Uncharacterized protein n=1 Tax=Streptomyces minutiscleroticus TaxID=68238 RepID=A0A918P5B0_9ACTN|nr:hypothetical protein GCM10010358_83630 [Streptomyces minutiscleroticus]